MSKAFKSIAVVNKKTGQLITYVNKKGQPRDLQKAIKDQPQATRKLFWELKRWK